jgi:preprotein translocase subunit SecA
MNEQRKVIYAERRRVLEGEDLHDQVQHMITDVVTAYVNGATSEGYAEDWDFEKLWTALKTLYPVSMRWQALAGEDEDAEPVDDLTAETLRGLIIDDAVDAYQRREEEIDGKVGVGAMRELERRVLLSVLDRKWREHLYEMDYLKEGIGLRAMAQRDPLIEYQREGFEMFNAMLEALKEESVGFLFNLQVEAAEPEPAGEVPAESPTETTTVLAPIGGGDHPREAPTQQMPAIRAGARHAMPDDEVEAPAALRGGGLERMSGPSLTYSGPTEDGGVESHRDGNGQGGNGNGNGNGSGGGSRRERREAQRKAAKAGKKRSRR